MNIATIFAQQCHQQSLFSNNLLYIFQSSTKKLYYLGYILPFIDYGSSNYGTTSKANMERISTLRKTVERMFLHADNTSSSEMFNTLGWQTVTKPHNYNKKNLNMFLYNSICIMVVNRHYAHIVKSTLKGHRPVIGKKGIDWLKSSARYLS